jgi:hypothetical protein
MQHSAWVMLEKQLLVILVGVEMECCNEFQVQDQHL